MYCPVSHQEPPPQLTTTPVPLRPTVCGEPLALSTIETEPDLAPVASGVNVTPNVHEFPAVSVAPQVEFTMAKSVEFVPVREMLLIDSVAAPEFCSVTLVAELVVFTPWLPKLIDVGFSVTDGTMVYVALATELSVYPVPPHTA